MTSHIKHIYLPPHKFSEQEFREFCAKHFMEQNEIEIMVVKLKKRNGLR